jgi:hypothetical protein
MNAQSKRLFNNFKIARSRELGYEPDNKAAFHRAGVALLRKVAQDLGLKSGEYDVRSNKGGPAVGGEIWLSTDKLNIELPGFKMHGCDILYRSCEGRKDYGKGNLWLSLENLDYDMMIETFRKVQER